MVLCASCRFYYCSYLLLRTIVYNLDIILLAENQKGANAVQQCSVENQKGAIAIAPFWFWCSNSTLLVLNGTSLNSDNALLALNSWFPKDLFVFLLKECTIQSCKFFITTLYDTCYMIHYDQSKCQEGDSWPMPCIVYHLIYSSWCGWCVVLMLAWICLKCLMLIL